MEDESASVSVGCNLWFFSAAVKHHYSPASPEDAEEMWKCHWLPG